MNYLTDGLILANELIESYENTHTVNQPNLSVNKQNEHFTQQLNCENEGVNNENDNVQQQNMESNMAANLPLVNLKQEEINLTPPTCVKDVVKSIELSRQKRRHQMAINQIDPAIEYVVTSEEDDNSVNLQNDGVNLLTSVNLQTDSVNLQNDSLNLLKSVNLAVDGVSLPDDSVNSPNGSVNLPDKSVNLQDEEKITIVDILSTLPENNVERVSWKKFFS